MIARLSHLSPSSRLLLAVALLIPGILLIALVIAVTSGLTLHADLSHAKSLAGAERDFATRSVSAREANAAFIHAASSGLATASLERRLAEILSGAGLVQRSMEVLPETARGQGPVIVSVEATGDVARLGRALYEIETGSPLLFVRSLDIRNDRSGEQVAADAPVDLAIRIVVEGHARLEPGQ